MKSKIILTDNFSMCISSFSTTLLRLQHAQFNSVHNINSNDYIQCLMLLIHDEN